MKIRVYVEDTDIGGIVYHANYIKYCERARSEAFFQANIPLGKDGCFLAVKNLEANFIKPTYLGDLLEVKTEILERKKASFKALQTITRGDEKVFEMSLVIVYLCQGKPKRLPSQIYDFLLTY